MKNSRVITLLLCYFFAYLGLGLVFNGSGYNNEYYVIISVATFLYGIFIAFSIYSHQTRLSQIKEMLRKDDSCLLSTYRQSSVFGKDVQHKVVEFVDKYLMTQINYRLQDDYQESAADFKNLYNFVLEIEPLNDKQTAVYQSMISELSSAASNRKLVGTLVRQKMTRLEWVSILSLHTLIAFVLFIFNTSSVLLSLLSSLIVVAGFIMIVVLHQLNNLTWQEEEWIWQPLHNLFLDLGLLPYYPEPAIDQGRVVIPSGSKVRVCRYNNPYPDMTNNEIHTVVI